MRSARYRALSGMRPAAVRWIVLVGAFIAAVLVGTGSADAQISSVSPGSARISPGSSVSVTVTTDAGSVALASGSAPNVSVAQSGFRFTFTAFTTATPGTYGYTFTDGESTGSFTLTVDPPPTTTTSSTTTTTQASTTTRPPATTTTTRPTTTTTRRTTTTTRPTTTTTSSTTTTTTTTTLAPTTTAATTTTASTSSTTTTTTIPPTTTTSTLIPAGIVALDGEGGSSGPGVPFVWFGAGAALLAALLAGAYVIRSRQRPTYGAATSSVMLAWRQRNERRKVSRTSHTKPTAGLKHWWQTSGPIVAYHEWQASRHATKTVRRQIEERQRLRNQDD